MPRKSVIIRNCAGGLLYASLLTTAAAQEIASLDQLLEVQVRTATLAKQSLRDAPADVTVITAADIRRYGYRTLGEVLSNIRGFYVTHDSVYQYVGVRGFSLLGDFNTRFLVMIDSHPLTDNVYGAMPLFGQDFGLDLDLVDQIEIVRGPSSALYGSNGMFATINILTRKAGVARSGRVSTELGSFGETKAIASGSFTFGRSGSALFSVSGLHSVGREATLANATVPGIGKERGIHTFTSVAWNNWNLTAMFGERTSSGPIGYYGADVGDTGTAATDGRNFVELAWSRSLGENRAVRWRAHYDQYRYSGSYRYLTSLELYNFDGAVGDWVGQQLVYQHRLPRFGSLTLGAETSFDIRNNQYNYYVDPNGDPAEQVDGFVLNHPNAGYAVFAQHEINLGSRFTLYTGGRVDDTKNNKLFLSPRIALIYKQPSTSYKLMYGGAFRNPSTYEKYWEPNPDLLAERMTTIEISREQTIKKRVTLVTSLFHYRLRDMIGGVPVSDIALQFRNIAKARATGAEVELQVRLTTWMQAAGGYTFQRTQGGGGEPLENSPRHIAQVRSSFPIAGDRLVPAVAFRHLSSRATPYGQTVDQVSLVDLTATTRSHQSGLRLQFGVRNLLDKRFSDPLSTEHIPQTLPRAGRTFFVKLTWQSE